MKNAFGALFMGACLFGSNLAVAQECIPCTSNPCCAPVFNGFYVGGNVGLIDYSAERSENTFFLVNGSTIGSDIDWTAGVQLGYDYLRCQSWLLGLVADWNWSNAQIDSNRTILGSAEIGSINSHLHWLSTLRVRAGFLAHPRCLFYLSAGAAVSEVKSTFSRNSAALGSGSFRFTKTLWGWSGGGGIECALLNRWTVFTEVLYTRFSSKQVNFDFLTPPNIVGNVNIRWFDQAWVGRMGINYRFSL